MRRPPGFNALRIPAHFNARSGGIENCVNFHVVSGLRIGLVVDVGKFGTTFTPRSRASARALSCAVGEKSIACTSSPCSASQTLLRPSPSPIANTRQQRLALDKKIVRRLAEDVIRRTVTCFPTFIFLTQFCFARFCSITRSQNNLRY
jgi:hypothetical protein